MQKIEGHFKLVASDPEKLEKLSIRISEFIDKLK
jgi:hypothetical protein